jgi:hypothetical protein
VAGFGSCLGPCSLRSRRNSRKLPVLASGFLQPGSSVPMTLRPHDRGVSWLVWGSLRDMVESW